jgi:hypothetical protein
MDNEKLSILTELIKLARTDRVLRDEEFNFLYTIAKQLEITDEQFKGLFEKYIEFTPPKSELDRIVQFQRLILVMNIDRDVNQEELDHVRNIGIKMALQPSATNELLRLMKTYENGVIPPDKLISVFRIQHN